MRRAAPFRAATAFTALCVVAAPTILAQSCSNYGSLLSNGTCDCPPGTGGNECSSLSCTNPLVEPSLRAVFNATTQSSTGCPGSSQCSSGFGGPTCGVCQSDAACQTVLGTMRVANTSEVQCSTDPWTWTEGFVSCSVVNPTLQSVFPGNTTLTIQKTANTSLSLSAPFGSDGTTQAQLWYADSGSNKTITEQFYCKADTCVQTNSTSTSTVDWSCQNLACTCIPGTMFCGGGGALDLTTTINGLSGTLDITCAQNGSTCAFKQSVLDTLFGANGLSLTGCSSGECVRASTIATLASQLVASDASSSSGLSPGVIAGLAVLGAIVLALLLMIVWGLVAQKEAKRAPAVVLDDKSAAVGLRWKDIGYTLRGSRRFFGLGSSRLENDGKVVLNGISGEVAPGTFLACLGPTGVGKSTLMDILGGKRKSGRISGSVELLSEGKTANKVLIGYVDQTDVLPPTSTVKEALMFAAELKLGESTPKEVKRERVFEVLKQLGLLDVADTFIGDVDRRGISGGERRRLSIGLELIAAPAILILDEPTSGLDSVSAMRVVQVLKTLASSTSGHRTTVIATLHQPNSQIFHSFDSVLVLGIGGRQIYHGPASKVVPSLAERGFKCPEGWNPADYLLELACDPPPHLFASHSADVSSSSSQAQPSEEESSKEVDVRALPAAQHASKGAKHLRQAKPATVMFTQFEVLAGREIRNLKRDWTLVVMHNLVAAIVGLVVGGLFYKVNTTIAGFQNRVGSLFFLGSLLAFSSLSALTNFLAVKSLFLRERAGAYYSPVAWLLSRVAFDIVPLRIIPTLIISCIVYWMVGLSHNAAHFFKFLLILVEFNIGTTLWNLFLAAAIPDPGTAILLSAVINLYTLAYAGFFLHLSDIPPVLRWLQWLAPLKYALEALAVNEVSAGLMIDDTLEGVKVQISAAVIMQTLFGFTPSAYYRDVLVLFAFIAGFAVLVVSTVVWKLREIR